MDLLTSSKVFAFPAWVLVPRNGVYAANQRTDAKGHLHLVSRRAWQAADCCEYQSPKSLSLSSSCQRTDASKFQDPRYTQSPNTSSIGPLALAGFLKPSASGSPVCARKFRNDPWPGRRRSMDPGHLHSIYLSIYPYLYLSRYLSICLYLDICARACVCVYIHIHLYMLFLFFVWGASRWL